MCQCVGLDGRAHDSAPRFRRYCVAGVIDFQFADLMTIGLLVLLEGLLSADNALVLAILVMGLPRAQQTRALRYGMIGAFGFRFIAILLAAYLIQVAWVRLAGGAYLLYLAVSHFRHRGTKEDPKALPVAKPAWGLSAFWATVVRVELIDIAFSVDSILVAVALSPKLWVVVTGGILGIITMRLVAGQLIAVIRRYPAIVDGAFVIIGWIGIKLLLEYGHQMHWISWQIPKAISLGLIVAIFVVSFLYARRHGPAAGLDVSEPGSQTTPAQPPESLH
jgi:YkoY family integral membrane protein